MEDSLVFVEYILWVLKKKCLYWRVILIDFLLGGDVRVYLYLKIRKCLIFLCLEESERKEKEEVLSNIFEVKEELNNDEKNFVRMLNSCEDKWNRSSFDLLKVNNVCVE